MSTVLTPAKVGGSVRRGVAVGPAGARVDTSSGESVGASALVAKGDPEGVSTELLGEVLGSGVGVVKANEHPTTAKAKNAATTAKRRPFKAEFADTS